ncbi:MAG: hypothetical protein OXB88_08295 [Bacteriovoracales bacterium]|nr:hypothetical protein [Bacteriovoracales bacterium]
MSRNKVAKIILLTATLIFFQEQRAQASECKRSQTKKKDGYIVFDQTALSKEGKERLINHVISVSSSIMSTVKMVKYKCKAPSFYLYNGANVVDGLANIGSLIRQKDESKQVLEAFVGEGSDINAQIVVFDRAHDLQMKAYDAAKRREDILKSTSMVRKGAVVAAGIEAITMKISPNPGLLCMSAEGKKALIELKKGLSESALAPIQEQTWKDVLGSDKGKKILKGDSTLWKKDKKGLSMALGRNLETSLVKVLMAMARKGLKGEVTPTSRLIFYGAEEIFAMAVSNDMKKVSNCMKERAEEYKAMGLALRNRLGTTAPGSDDENTDTTTLPTFNDDTETNHFDITRNDFAGCLNAKTGQLADDPQCSCTKTNSCYKIPDLNFNQNPLENRNDKINLPSGLASTIGKSRDFLNGVFGGNFSKAKLASGSLGQGAGRLNRQIKALKKKINDDRRKKGQKPIDFDKESQKLAQKMRRSVGKALSDAGIGSIGQFNEALARDLLQDDLGGAGDNGLQEPTWSGGGPLFGGGRGTASSSFEDLEEGYGDLLSDQASEDKGQNGQGDLGLEGQEYYADGGHDIHQGKGEDIFKIITLRYQESGYPTLLKKKKTTKEGPSPAGKAAPR